MLTMMLTLAMLGQDDYLPTYEPKPGDNLVLGVSGGGRFYVASNFLTVQELDKTAMAKDQTGLDEMMEKGQAVLISSDTPVLYIKRHDYRSINQPDVSEVRILSGRFKDKIVFAHTLLVRKLDPEKVAARERAEADARVWQEKKAKRQPLNEVQIVKDLQAAIKQAKSDTAKLTPYNAKTQKKAIMKKAIEGVSRKHIADLDELNMIAIKANISISFDGQKYDLLGNKVK